MSLYSIRPMHKEDLPQVNEIDREAFPTQWPPPNYTRELELPLARYLVAVDPARIIPGVPRRSGGLLSTILPGWFRRKPSASDTPPAGQPFVIGFAGIWLMADEAHITNIAVRRSLQRRGIGELLLISLVDLSSQLNASMLTLEVRASNTTAQELYRKYGFTEVGVRRGYYLDNKEDGILMSTPGITSTSFQTHYQQVKQAYFRRHHHPDN